MQGSGLALNPKYYELICAAKSGVPDTADNLYAFFLGRVRDRLHVILCFSPVGNKFARRAQQFPGLINGCGQASLAFNHPACPASMQ